MDELHMTAPLETTPYRVTPNQAEKQESSSIEIPATKPISPIHMGRIQTRDSRLGSVERLSTPKTT
jgi:hypothetical protein